MDYHDKIADVLRKAYPASLPSPQIGADAPGEAPHLPWREALDIANAEIATLRAQLAEGRVKWISIEDRYPPVAPDGWSDLVQICADGEVCAGYWSEPDNAWMTGYDEIPNQNRITHWCPMADPPNAKQSTPAPDATALREAAEIGRDYVAAALAEHDERYKHHPATEPERETIAADLAVIDSALLRSESRGD